MQCTFQHFKLFRRVFLGSPPKSFQWKLIKIASMVVIISRCVFLLCLFTIWLVLLLFSIFFIVFWILVFFHLFRFAGRKLFSILPRACTETHIVQCMYIEIAFFYYSTMNNSIYAVLQIGEGGAKSMNIQLSNLWNKMRKYDKIRGRFV